MYAQSKRLMMDDFELLSAYIDGEVNTSGYYVVFKDMTFSEHIIP